MTTTAATPTMLLEEIEAVSVERLSPSFVRVEFGSPALADLAVDGPLYDQRIKLIFPNAAGRLPSFEGADESWFETWLDIPENERGSMRTYTIRDSAGAAWTPGWSSTSWCTGTATRPAPATNGERTPRWASG